MLNNEFRLIGTAVSDFKLAGSDDFKKYLLDIEVEKKTKKAPSVFTLQVFESNKSVKVDESLKGKRIIVQGYLDTYKEYTRLVVQDIIIIGAIPEEKPKEIEGANLEELDLPDDGLPF